MKIFRTIGTMIVTLVVSIKDGKLSLEIRNGITVFSDRGLVLAFAQASKNEAWKDILLTPASADVFVTYVDGESVILRFTRNQQNAISGFTLTNETVRRLRFDKLYSSRYPSRHLQSIRADAWLSHQLPACSRSYSCCCSCETDACSRT